MNPTVSFVVPCYRLAHLLPECINSILGQTFRDFEILIMDDCSPDNTAAVAKSFQDQDERVIHIRNQPNLGHLPNYNKGISLAKGKYVWLISADDYLRRPYVLERYVELLNRNPSVGYVFCPAVKVRGGQEISELGYSSHGNRDTIFDGRKLLLRLAWANLVVAASGCVRKECYEKVSLFPLDMPWGGDWYLWAMFAFSYNVGYFAEPMVCYREHELSMTNKLMKEDVAQCSKEDIAMPWIIKRTAAQEGYQKLVRECLDSAAYDYARRLAAKRYPLAGAPMSFDQFEESLCRNTTDEGERDHVRSRVYALIADEYYWNDQTSLAREYYSAALRKAFWRPALWAKSLLLYSGPVGNALRKGRVRLLR